MVKIGDKVHIHWVNEEPEYTGKEGIVTHIDNIGQIHGTWGPYALIEEDDFDIISPKN